MMTRYQEITNTTTIVMVRMKQMTYDVGTATPQFIRNDRKQNHGTPMTMITIEQGVTKKEAIGKTMTRGMSGNEDEKIPLDRSMIAGMIIQMFH